MNILIVDDDLQRQEQLQDFLVVAAIGKISCCDTMDAAREMLRANYFDVLILDVVLPKRRGDAPNFENGLALLGQISRSPLYKKPEKIIALTAHISDISRFRDEYDRFCLAVIEANPVTAGWKTKVLDSINYTFSSKLARKFDAVELNILTLHGIRTFGDWQGKIKTLVNGRVSGVSFHTYKYGFFSTVALLLPWVRNVEISRLTRRMKQIFENKQSEKFVIFAHSFGTLLIAMALRRYLKSGGVAPIHTLVLCGSVLPENFNWSYLEKQDVRIINDCADDDYILWLSKAFVLGTGMAGKSGFNGFENQRLVNRFFTGGHSSYFEGDEFILRHWLPLLDFEAQIHSIDNRTYSFFHHEIFEKIIVFIGYLKIPAYFILTIFIAHGLFKLKF